MSKISADQIKDYLQSQNINAEVYQLKDTLGNQELFRVRVKGMTELKDQLHIKQVIQNKYHTAVTDVQFTMNENLHYDYNGSHMLVYDIESKYNNVYSAKLQISIDDNTYGYDVLFDDMKGIVEWDKDYNEINKEHTEDGTSKDFKGLIDMFNIALQGRVNISKHVKNNPKSSTNKRKKKAGAPKILLNYDQSKGVLVYVLIKDLSLSSTAFNKLIQELAGQSLYVTYEKRKNDMSPTPTEIFVGRNGGRLSDADMTNLTKILSKNGIDMSDYQYVDVDNLNMLPVSALIKASSGQLARINDRL